MSFHLNDFNLFALAKRTGRPLILDGAMGSLLQQKGIEPDNSLWMSYANLDFPEKVLSVHREYIEAGADIITTNTFRTNPSAAENSSKEQVKAAVNLAIESKGTLPVLIAGSNAPAEDCYQVERKISISKLEYNHHKHIDLLADHGVDFILNETQSHLDEIRIVCEYCSLNRIPFVISLFFNRDLKLLSGEYIMDIIPVLLQYSPLAIGFNCILPPVFRKLLKEKLPDYAAGFYLNCGDGAYTDKDIKCGIYPKDYASIVKEFLDISPAFVGACCGSNPEHIYEIKSLLKAAV